MGDPRRPEGPRTGRLIASVARLRARLAVVLARRRVSIGFVLFPLVAWLAAPKASTVLVGAPIAAAGEAIRVWAAGHLRKNREVTASGPYRWVAHPLYVGSSVMAVGLAIGSGSWAAASLIGAYVAVTIGAAVSHEETGLRSRFGDRYDRYRSGEETGDGETGRRFSLAQAMRNREYRAVVGLALALLLLALKATYNQMFGGRPGG